MQPHDLSKPVLNIMTTRHASTHRRRTARCTRDNKTMNAYCRCFEFAITVVCSTTSQTPRIPLSKSPPLARQSPACICVMIWFTHACALFSCIRARAAKRHSSLGKAIEEVDQPLSTPRTILGSIVQIVDCLQRGPAEDRCTRCGCYCHPSR